MPRFSTIQNKFSASPAEKYNFINDLELKEFDLSNGLHCILHKNNKNPMVNVSIGYDVGSKDENPDKKGIAHLFEHLMFQGSDNVKKNEHFQYVQQAGGSCNAFTMQDLTAYYDIVPSHQLETVLWLESDRMNSLDLTDENLLNQKNVVLEEKMQRYDNAPYGTALHNIFKFMMKGSFYETPVIGFNDDIRSFKLNEAIEFHSTYYSPKNSVLVLSGDIEYGDAETKIRKYFEAIKNGGEIERKKNGITDFTENETHTIRDNITLPAVYICYRIPPLGHIAEYALDYFSSILANDKSSRLYKKLVYEKKLAKSIHVNKYQLKDGGIFIIKAEVVAGKDIETLKSIILDEINDIAENGITDYEFNKVRNEIEFFNIVKSLTLQKIAIETLFNWIMFKDTGLINSKVNKYLSLDKNDITHSVKEYFTGKSKLVLTYLPKEN